MASLTVICKLKRYFNIYSTYIDFLSASLIISLCIAVLLPKVHDSFGPKQLAFPQARASLATLERQAADQTDHDEHRLPIGEILVCVGFLVFYCLGLGVSKEQASRSRESAPMLVGRDSTTPTVCCPSTRCPTLPAKEPSAAPESARGSDKLHVEESDESCLMLLNRHHNHHVHAHHHDHGQAGASESPLRRQKRHYGTEQQVDTDSGELESHTGWPTSAKVTLFALIFAGLLIVLDLHMHGMVQAIKVFRAGATGALLYVALYLVLPRNSAGCRTCTEEVAC